MAADNKNIDLLQRFIENEKNAKRWTIMSVSLFCLLAFAIIILAGKLKKEQKENESLKLALAQATLIKVDSTNQALTTQNNQLANNNANYDSLQEITNSLLINLAELKKEKPGEDVVSKNDALINKATQEKIKKLITPASIREMQEKEIKYTVFIQFTEDYTDLAKRLQQGWQNQYICPEPEIVSKNSFDPVVRYFYDIDRQEAVKLAGIVQRQIRLPVNVSFVKMKAPKKQIEVWLGKYQPQTTEQIFKKYDINKDMLEQKRQ